MSLKGKLLLYTLVSSLIIVSLYSLIVISLVQQIIDVEARKEYSKIVNTYKFSRSFSFIEDEFARDDLQTFKELSFFIKKINDFELIFIYNLGNLKRLFADLEDFLKGKTILENYIIEGDIPKDSNLIKKALETTTYRIYGSVLSPILIYTYPINLKGNVIGKVIFIEYFPINKDLVLGIYIFIVAFTLLNVYLPIRIFRKIVEEIKYLSKLAHDFSKKDFSKIEELRRNIRETQEKNEIYQLKKAILKMVEELDKYIRRLKNMVENYENLAFTDPLTGLYNRRMFLELAKKKLDEAKRYQEPFSIIMLDIDNFKNINDTYGHDVGDEALKHLANILRENVRSSDIIARWGGEEFIILLPKTSLEQAYRVAEKIRKIVEMSTIELGNGNKLKFTISLGVASYRGQESLEELLKEADIALYEAKRKGKNRTEIYKQSLSL